LEGQGVELQAAQSFSAAHTYILSSSSPSFSSSSSASSASSSSSSSSAPFIDQPSFSFVPECIPHWLSVLDDMSREHAAPPAMLSTLRAQITEGVSFVFPDGPPPPRHLRNNSSVLDHAPAVRTRISDLLKMGSVVVLPAGVSCPFLQPLHVVVHPLKKARPCLDLSQNFNEYVADEALSYESLQSSTRILCENIFMCKSDLSDCFLAFPIHLDFQKYFCFEFDGVIYRFTSLCFGLKSAPAIVTNLLSVISFALHKENILHIRYLDDFLFSHVCRHLLTSQLRRACEIFLSFGLTINLKKLVLPCQLIEFLGILVCSPFKCLQTVVPRFWHYCATSRAVARLPSGIYNPSLASFRSFRIFCMPLVRLLAPCSTRCVAPSGFT
jgi:hypothetical protein